MNIEIQILNCDSKEPVLLNPFCVEVKNVGGLGKAGRAKLKNFIVKTIFEMTSTKKEDFNALFYFYWAPRSGEKKSLFICFQLKKTSVISPISPQTLKDKIFIEIESEFSPKYVQKCSVLVLKAKMTDVFLYCLQHSTSLFLESENLLENP
jgi:hypothetical protein